MIISALRSPLGSGYSTYPIPILKDLSSVPSLNTSIRKAGMLTTMRVSLGTAFGPGSIVGSAGDSSVATSPLLVDVLLTSDAG